MSWTEHRSRRRIGELLASVPQNAIRVEDFATSYRQRRDLEVAMGIKSASTVSIDDIPYNAVVMTEGVHVYAKLLDYDAFLENQGREPEASARVLLEFVHLHYSGMDRLIDAYGAQRVDHHGGRVHAVVLEPTGAENEGRRLEVALALASSMRALVSEASAAHQRKYGSRIRVGVESGPALAINSGRKAEPEPLFIGDAANVAAKMADGDEDGVVLGPRARILLSANPVPSFSGKGILLNEARYLGSDAERTIYGAFGLRSKVDEAFREFRAVELATAGSAANFVFFRHALPLKDIDFPSLSPSRTVRQEVVSIFADLSGFTKYVHEAMASNSGIREAVSNLHVLRGELAAAVRDFGGRKIRFIGDCIHAILAEGSQHYTNEMDTIRQAVRLAGALRSSFELCQTLLPGIGDLGLTIGIEIGSTPITRLGIRGVRSVRCASSKAVAVSERIQQACSHNETALGENAFASAPSSIRRAFGSGGVIHNLDYLAAVAFATALATPAIARSEPQAAEPHAR